MTKIEQQQRAIQNVENEIEQARKRVQTLSAELAGLQNATEPDDLSRRAGLVLALERARSALPIRPPPLRAEWRPKIQQRLEIEQDKLDVLRHTAWHLSREVERISEKTEKWAGRLPEAQRAWRVIIETFNHADFYPGPLDRQLLHGVGLALGQQMAEIASLPGLEKRLAEVGSSDDWRPAGQRDEIDDEFVQERR